ncbi:hypothetical protein NGB37_01830 [Escherichia coli]|nr:hypothetical protein [Escherichia coli]
MSIFRIRLDGNKKA